MSKEPELNELFEAIAEEMSGLPSLGAEVVHSGNTEDAVKQLILVGTIHSRLLFGIYSELVSARCDRQQFLDGGKSSGVSPTGGT